MKKLLITCFEPFGGETSNASAAGAEKIDDRIGDFAVEKLLLPVEFSRAAELAITKAEEIGADAIICFGQAGARNAVTPEMVALNLCYTSVPDNAGEAPQDKPVIFGAENALFATLPVRKMSQTLKENGVLSAVSYSAGTYVCNDLYFRVLHRFKDTGVRAAFIHVPRESEAFTAQKMANAVEKMIEKL